MLYEDMRNSHNDVTNKMRNYAFGYGNSGSLSYDAALAYVDGMYKSIQRDIINNSRGDC